VKVSRLGGAIGLAAAGALALAACGSDNSSTPTASGSSAAGGSSAAAGAATDCATGTLTLAGSTAQANATSAWIKAYQTKCSGSTITDGGGGSGAGVTSFTNKTVDFAGSDYPLSATQKPDADKACGTGGAEDLPMVPGGIALGYNLDGVKDLKLSAATIAEIYTGKIKKWNDPAIAKDNAGVTLPSTTITTFSRSDTSGTSFNFSNYLANVAKADFPYAANKQWPAPGGQSAKGSSAVAQAVKSTPGAIGYFELSYATQAGLPTAQVGRADGSFATISTDTVNQFLAHATVASTASGNDLPLSFDYTATDGYPIALVTYEIVCATPTKDAALLKSFLTYTSGDGQSILAANGYVPLPTAIQTKVQAAVAAL
jgi:phosphate transport system substrate-binding protein